MTTCVMCFSYKTFNVMIICIFLVCYQPMYELFDSVSSFSYMSIYFLFRFNMMFDFMHVTIHVSTLMGHSLVVHRVYQSCLVCLVLYDTWAVRFDIVLGMDCL